MGGVQGKKIPLEAGQDHPCQTVILVMQIGLLCIEYTKVLLKLSSSRDLVIQHHIWDARVKRGLEGLLHCMCVYIHLQNYHSLSLDSPRKRRLSGKEVI